MRIAAVADVALYLSSVPDRSFKANLAGGTDNGAPDLRPYCHQDYFGAFVLDLDGCYLEAGHHPSASACDSSLVELRAAGLAVRGNPRRTLTGLSDRLHRIDRRTEHHVPDRLQLLSVGRGITKKGGPVTPWCLGPHRFVADLDPFRVKSLVDADGHTTVSLSNGKYLLPRGGSTINQAYRRVSWANHGTSRHENLLGAKREWKLPTAIRHDGKFPINDPF